MLSYKDVVLLPSYSEIKSRAQLDAGVEFLGRKFKSAAIPANMLCSINFELAEQLSESGHFYILHRFYEYYEILDWIYQNQDLALISISVGVNENDYNLINKIFENKCRVDYITIDVAHGHHVKVKHMINYIKNKTSAKIIAGNVGTAEAASDLHRWGSDAVKAGLSMGKSCTTYNCTGVGTPMFSLIKSIKGIPVIADGQIREVGDVCKALVAGANMVMIGSEFAKCVDSPAKIKNGKKEFFGSASEFTKGHKNYVEGKKVELPLNPETYGQYIKRINQGVQSCMSYSGVSEISKLKGMKYKKI